jgi:hypothetical protein
VPSHEPGQNLSITVLPASGGTWTAGTAGPRLELDAIDFCRVISKRPGPVDLTELLSTEVPY